MEKRGHPVMCGVSRAEMEPGLRVTGSLGSAVSDFGRVGSGNVSVSDPVLDLVLSFNMRVYRGVVSTE